nr:malonyl-CoA decarboxylase, mitochondrial [Ipomoea batatas]GMC55800.1 malonyl-CoA decarboxylase, mitochondrial [Ipomoea batatas]GME17726.1 malonyl-CoA decarboxylase, mitochondrial [Ipomoea batatas]
MIDFLQVSLLFLLKLDGLMKDAGQRMQEVLWDDPPILECDATILLYSINSDCCSLVYQESTLGSF